MTWSHKLRGFREGFTAYGRHENPLEAYFRIGLLEVHGIKTKAVLVSERTNFQNVDIVKTIDLQGNPVVFDRPDKVLFLDGEPALLLFGFLKASPR